MFLIKLFRLVLWIWCLPQNIAGFFFTKFGKFEKSLFAPDYGTKNITKSKMIKFIRWLRTDGLPNYYYFRDDDKFVTDYGVSLGFYICFSCTKITKFSPKDIDHENGHRVQSALLGPFYLIFVGISSLINFVYSRLIYSKKHNTTESRKAYHAFFIEAWADKLGSC